MGEISFGFKYGTSVKCDYGLKGEPVLRIPNVRGGRIDTSDLKYGPLSASEAADLRLQIGDILMVRSNGSLDLVGRATIVDENAVGYCYAGYLVRVRTRAEFVDIRYLWIALSSPHLRDQIEIPIRTTVGLKNVNTTELSSLMFPFPPLAEQRRIVARVDELMALCDALQEQIELTEINGRRLLDAALSESLAGLASANTGEGQAIARIA